MTKEEYEQKRREIIESYQEEIWEHESAGCRGDADNTRKWMNRALEALKNEYEERQEDVMFKRCYRGNRFQYYDGKCPTCHEDLAYGAAEVNAHNDCARLYYACECGSRGFDDVGLAPNDDKGMSEERFARVLSAIR